MSKPRNVADSGRVRIGPEFGTVFVVSALGYWLLVGQLSADEIGLGLWGGALAALWAVAVSRTADIRFRFEWKAVAAVAEAIAGVPRAATQVTRLLIAGGRRRPRGGIIEQRFHHGRERSAADATRRAAVLLAVSLAPDRFVLGHEDGRLRVHRLAGGAPGGDEEWPA